jgi:aryl-alcohol dehydrogenase-like predicted oxidoreductase
MRLGDLEVYRLGFGAMRVCGAQVWGPPKDRAHALTVLRPSPPPWVPDGRPEHLRRALEGSLRRLRLERIDLYQWHAPDSRVPFTESFGALAEMRKAGKIRHLGLSNVSVAQLEEARRIAPLVSVQNSYSIDHRASEDVLKVCERHGLAFLPWYPLGAGSALRSARVKRVAARIKAAPAQVAIAWLLAHSRAMLPIPGTASFEHLEENARAAQLALTPQDMQELD